MLNTSDAVVFHIRNMDLQNLPDAEKRQKNQYFVFFLLESPIYTHMDLNSLKGFFNVTISYRYVYTRVT